MHLMPTGRCFDDALEFLQDRVKVNPRLATSDRLWLCHGICVGTGSCADGSIAPGQRYAHAWVEERDPAVGQIAWDAGLLDGERIFVVLPRDIFHDRRQVAACTRYTPVEAWAENNRTETYGPWRLEYLALCKRKATTR